MQVKRERTGSDEKHSQAIHPEYRFMDQTNKYKENALIIFDFDWNGTLSLATEEKREVQYINFTFSKSNHHFLNFSTDVSKILKGLITLGGLGSAALNSLLQAWNSC